MGGRFDPVLDKKSTLTEQRISSVTKKEMFLLQVCDNVQSSRPRAIWTLEWSKGRQQAENFQELQKSLSRTLSHYMLNKMRHISYNPNKTRKLGQNNSFSPKHITVFLISYK